MRRRIVVSLVVGVLSALLCYGRLLYGNCAGGECQAGDFTWSLRGAEQLLDGLNPYHDPSLGGGRPYPNNAPLFYPMPALLIALPFVSLPREVGGALFFGLSSGLLAFGVFRDGFARWPIFLSGSFWFTLVAVQWSPLLLASVFLPALVPVALAKPNIGLPVVLSFLRLEKLVQRGGAKDKEPLQTGSKGGWQALLSRYYPPWRGLLVAFGVVLLSFVLLPTWLGDWLDNAGTHSVFVPLLVFPGFLLGLAVLRWRQQEARLLILLALVPQRPLYDQFLLWVVPQSFWQMFWFSMLSWVTIFGWLLWPSLNVQWIVLGMYVPALVLVLWGARDAQGGP